METTVGNRRDTPEARPTPECGGAETVRTLLDALVRNLERQPDALVYRFARADGGTAESLTHAGLAQRVGRCARGLRALGGGGAARPLKVVLMLPQGGAFVAAFFACIAAGAVAVPTFAPKNERQAERAKRVLLDLQDALVLAEREDLDGALVPLRADPELARVRWVAVEELACEGDAPLTDFQPDPDAVAMLQYTSGSTGQPCGVMVSNRNLVENSELIRQAFGHDRPNRRGVIWLPPHHDMGLVGGVVQPVHAGFPMLVMPTSAFVRHPVRWLQAIDEFRATTSGGPNFAFEMCVEAVRDRDLARLDLSTWDLAFCGAEPISHATMVAFGRRFARAGFRPSALHPCYGMAETTLMVSGKHPLEDLRSLDVSATRLARGQVGPPEDGAGDGRALVSCGEVQPSLDLRVVDPVLHLERGEREIGELWVSGPSVAQGYWGHAEKTRQTFGQRLPGREGRYLRTGDLGFVEGGQLYVTGRLKEVLIVRGANLYPQDLEQEALLACPELAGQRAVAFQAPGARREEVVLALEAPRAAMDHEGLVRRIDARLVERFGLRADVVLFVPRKTIRTTTSGKLQRLALRADYLAGALPAYRVWRAGQGAARGPAERLRLDTASVDDIARWIIDRVAAITGVDPGRIRRDDRFVELALDSVTSLEMLSELDREHRIGLAPDVLYRHDTPERLAREIHRVSQHLRHADEGIAHAAG